MMPCTRPATAEEWREDLAKREAALDQAIADGKYSSKQIEEARRVNQIFQGYPRPTERISR